jgi:hypothetical protein
MSSSNAFRVLLTVALVASVAWKIVAATEHPTDWRNRLVEFFERNHFNVVVTEEFVTDVPIIQANTSSCRLQIAKIAPDGSDQSVVQHLAIGTDRLFFVVRGRVYTQQPTFWTQIDYLWTERLQELGLTKQLSPVIAVATNASCNAEQLPWAELLETS